MKTSKPILFIDFDGTLCRDKFWRSLPLKQYEVVQDFIFGRDNPLVVDWMKGRYSSEEINRLLAEKIGVSFEELWELFVNDCKTMRVSETTLNSISSLRSKYLTVLATVNMDCFLRFTVPVLHLDKYFDKIGSSSLSGKFKDDPSGDVFMEYAKSNNVSIKDCLLIDNSAKVCEVFTSIGGTAYLVTADRDVDYYLSENSNH